MLKKKPSSETQGQLVGAGKKSKPARKNSGEEKSITFLTFLCPNFFLPPLNCPWVSEDEKKHASLIYSVYKVPFKNHDIDMR